MLEIGAPQPVTSRALSHTSLPHPHGPCGNSNPQPPKPSPFAVGGAGGDDGAHWQGISLARPHPSQTSAGCPPRGGPCTRPPLLWPAPPLAPTASDASSSNREGNCTSESPPSDVRPTLDGCWAGGAAAERVVFLAPGLPPWRVFVEQLLPRGLAARHELSDSVLALRTAALRGAGANAPLVLRRGWASVSEPVQVFRTPPPPRPSLPLLSQRSGGCSMTECEALS